MDKSALFQQERDKLLEIFQDIEESKRKLVEGLIEDAAFLKAENHILKQLLNKTGMVIVHPTNNQLQKPTEASKQYLKNVNSYSVIIKTLNGVLGKNFIDDDDDLSDFE